MKNCTCFLSRFCLVLLVLVVSGSALCSVAASAAAHHPAISAATQAVP